MDDAERTIRQLRIDARATQEEAESSVAELARSTRSLRDALLDFGRAGHSMRVELAMTAVAGHVVHVGDDVIRLVRFDQGSVDIAMAAITAVRIESREVSPSTVSVGYPATLVARCRELLQAQALVEVGRRSAPPVRGELRAVTATHLELADRDAGAWLVPLTEAASVERISR